MSAEDDLLRRFIMQERGGKQKRKLNNVGSTLVTVLVGVGFLLILATMTIAISAGNLHMKQVEYGIISMRMNRFWMTCIMESGS